jgi:hypothetical protein
MILHPAIVALSVSSVLTSGMMLYSSFFGIQIIRRWDIKSGSEEQLALEKKTYLISTILSYVLFFQIVALFLFIYTADNLHNLFVGAMCAAGTLNANPYGYPTLLFKLLNFILAGLWLIVNFTDNQAYDYLLIKRKYIALIVLAPFFITEFVLQTSYFIRLEPDLITSCCGSLFCADKNSAGVVSDIVSAPIKMSMVFFYGSLAATFASGVAYLAKGKLGYTFSLASSATFLVSCASLISFISLYFYELPTHHCPFCILQREYGYVGYLLYVALLVGVVSGLGVGILTPLKTIGSLHRKVPAIQRRLTLTCLISYLFFAGISIIRMSITDFTLGLS